MSNESRNESALLRAVLVLGLIALAAAVRIAPHPWNFTPVGAMALFSGAMIRNGRVAFLLPLLAMFVGDVFVGLHKLIPIVYASFILSVAIGRLLRENRSVLRIGGATFLGALQFFLITNFAVWAFLGSYPHTAGGLFACYLAGMPLFWNTLAGDAVYATALFGGLDAVERLVPAVREPAYRNAA